MNVLSLFDGMSCGQIALNRAGIKYDAYYASEIEKSPIQITQKNYPNTIQLGNVLDLSSKDLPKIDLLIGGSPCQSFSTAGDNTGFDGKSGLFFEYARLLEECKPKYFLLENVIMYKKWENEITNILGISPIQINSSLVSAQNRNRLYWTNIPFTKYPTDRNIKLIDILDESDIDETQTFLHGKFINFCEQHGIKSFFTPTNKLVELYPDKDYLSNKKRIMSVCPLLSKSKCVTTSSMVMSSSGSIAFFINGQYRPITVTECERLQTVPNDYTAGVSNTDRCAMLGNGWTVDVIAHIFKNIGKSPVKCTPHYLDEILLF